MPGHNKKSKAVVTGLAVNASLMFWKMHGAGNDFVVLDCTQAPLPDASLVRELAHRQTGVGCDQVMVVVKDDAANSGFGYRIFNADGSVSEQCGNGARCVAAWLIAEKGCVAPFAMMSPSGPVAVALQQDLVCVTLSVPQLLPLLVPFRADKQALLYRRDVSGSPVEFSALSMGNPHVVIQVADVRGAKVVEIGAGFQQHSDFPMRTNVGFVERCGPTSVRLRVFERGVGETLACGSGACAAVVALTVREQLAGNSWVDVALPGGTLRVRWQGQGHPVELAGPTCFVFQGRWLNRSG